MKPKSHPSQDELNETFIYKDGNLLRATNRKPVGTLLNTGYTHVGFKNNVYLIHRIIYIMHHGDIPENMVVDHKDNDKTNNLISNLQAISQNNNVKKQKLHEQNKSGYRGCRKIAEGQYRAQISVNGTNNYIGTFSTMEDAARAYNGVARILYGDFAVLNKVSSPRNGNSVDFQAQL